MSSPFSPEQKNLIYAAVGALVLIDFWSALKAVREHYRTGNALRLAPLLIALLGLLVAIEAIMVVNLNPFFLQHALRIPTIPVIGLLLVLIASTYDQRHAPRKEKPPSRFYLFRARVQSSLDVRPVSPSEGTILAHLKSVLRFYLGTQEVSIVSRYGLEQALWRIRDLKKNGEVLLSEKKSDELILCATGVRGNVLPVFRGKLSERAGKAVLEGRIEIDSGIVIFLGLFGLILLVMVLASFFADKTRAERFFGLLAPLVFLFLLEFGYVISKGSPEIIVRNLERALRD